MSAFSFKELKQIEKDLVDFLNIHQRKFFVVFVFCLIFVLVIWYEILTFNYHNQLLKIYFLDVGQGDSQLVILPGGVKVLIDGGPPNSRAFLRLSELIPFHDRYLDLVVMTHIDKDHFGGLIPVLENYQVGFLIHNGQGNDSDVFKRFEQVVKEKRIKTLNLEAGDKIKYLENVFYVLNPNFKNFVLKKKKDNDNDYCLVLLLKSKNILSLFTADIGEQIESYLVKSLKENYSYLFKEKQRLDILKVAHHGSKYSSSEDFLDFLKPRFSVISVGKNSYGHPTKEVIKRLVQINSLVYRTDELGTVGFVVDGSKIKVIK